MLIAVPRYHFAPTIQHTDLMFFASVRLKAKTS